MLRASVMLTTLLFVSGCAAAPESNSDADRQAIAASTATTEAAENSGSVAQMRTQMADDVIMLAPNAPAVVGADAASAAMQSFFDAFTVQIDYQSQEIVAAGDVGFDRGTYHETMTPKNGGPPINQTGKYLWIYRRGDDGAWKQSRVMWNSSDPLPAAQ